ncbi:MAG: hypothetical protein ACK5NG_11265 [Chthoniobacterales bacterium]
MEKNSRTIKVKTPPGLIVALVIGVCLLLAAIFYGTWKLSSDTYDARKMGVITSKEFVPLKEKLLSVGDKGLVRESKDGEYILHVDVRGSDGSIKSYDVYLKDKERYDSLSVGDSFEVGPYLVKGVK